MRYRILFWIFIWIIVTLPAYLRVFKAKQSTLVRITGTPIIVTQNKTKCISRMGDFWWELAGFCQFSQNSKYSVIGSQRMGVIDVLMGRIWLSARTIEMISESHQNMFAESHSPGLFERFREKLRVNFDRHLPYAEAALVKGMVLGDKKGFDREYYQKIINSGLSHVVVASGYNIALVGGFVMSLLIYIWGRKTASLVTFATVWFYAMLTGGEPPVMRAVMMFVFVQMGTLLGRPQRGIYSLFVIVILMLLGDRFLIFDLSFQLTVAATWGMMVIDPWLQRYLKRFGDRLMYFVGVSGISTSLAGSLATAPFLFLAIGRFSLVGLLSNTLIGLFVPVITGLGFAMMLFPKLLSLPVYGLSHWTVLVINFFGR